MWPYNVLILVGCIVALALGGCKKSKQYPTAQAPKTITDPPPKPMKPAVDDDDDDDDDDGYDDDDAPTRPSTTRRTTSTGARAVAPREAPGAQVVPTINGHPKGPKAEVFNAVTRNALPNAAPCFSQHAPSKQTISVNVSMTVGNSGTVEEAKVVSGSNNPALRKCLVGVVKRLTFPPFQGPKVNKTIPFTAVRSPASGSR